MTLAQNFIGCDISKDFIDIFDEETRKLHKIANNSAELTAFIAKYSEKSVQFIMEATGVYDKTLRLTLDKEGLRYTRVNPKQAHSFGQSTGKYAKTDALDAKMLARMGRSLALEPDAPIDAETDKLSQLCLRRDQLVEARKIERQHIHSVEMGSVTFRDIEEHIEELDERIKGFERKIAETVSSSPKMSRKSEILMSCPGVGKVTSGILLSHFLELGTLSMQKVASLAGLCPFDRTSGTMTGKKSIKGGRKRVRTALYIAAVACIRRENRFRTHYLQLKARGKATKVALIAVARKILTTLNAMLKRDQTFLENSIKI